MYAIARDSVQASRRDADAQTEYLCRLAGVQDRVRVFPSRLQAPLAGVDIVTDLPGVRPIDEAIVRNVAGTAAVTLMRGVAHWRTADVDVATCRRGAVAVAGVDEDGIDLYRYLAMEAVWGLLQMGVEVVGATVLVAGDGPAYARVARGLADAGARVLVAAPEGAGRVSLYGGEKVGDGLGDAAARGRLAEADALILCPARPDDRTIGLRRLDRRGHAGGRRAAPRRDPPLRRARPARPGRGRPAQLAGRRRHLTRRPPAAAAHRPAHRRPQGG